MSNGLHTHKADTTYRQYHPVLELCEVLIALLAEVLRTSAALRDLLVAIRIGAGLVQAVLLANEGHGSFAVEVIWLLVVAQVQLLHL